jgi:hypothetical protein
MRLVHLMKRALAEVGIGSPRLMVCVYSETVRRGGAVQGAVIVTGGAVEQRMGRLAIKLTSGDVRMAKETEHWSTLLSEAVTVPAGSEKRLEFRLTIPEEAPLTTRTTEAKRTACRLETVVSGPWWRLAPSASRLLTVKAHAEVEAVTRAMNLLGFRNVQPKIVIKERNLPPYLMEYDSQENGLLERVNLAILPGPAFTRVEATLVTARHSLLERLQTRLGVGSASETIHIPRGDLLLEGEPYVAATVPHLRGLLERMGAQLAGEAARLLRASERPGNDVLLRPAGAGGGGSEELLRPHDGRPAAEETTQ